MNNIENKKETNTRFSINRKPTISRPLDQDNLKVIPLGGVEEIGINCTVYEYLSDIVVIDMGLGFPENEYYGIDYIVPDIKYLIQKQKNIKALVITHGHLDHIGALPYHLEPLGFPDIYATQFTIELIRTKIIEKGIEQQMNGRLHIIDTKSELKLGHFHISFFHVNHSIPQCVGVILRTPVGKVVHTGDFKFDNSPVNEPVADYAKIARLGEEDIDLLLSDSTNSLKKGHPVSESEVAKNLEDIIDRAEKRVIVATFSGLVGRLYQLLEIAKKLNKKVAIAGYSMNQTLRIAEEIGYIKIHQNLLVPFNKVQSVPPEKLMILTTGAQGEAEAGLSKMANEDYKGFTLHKGDTVILSAKTIAGNDRAVQNLIDSITRRGAQVRQIEEMDLFTSGHGYQEDQKIMLNLVKPKFFMPVHGYQYFLRAHGDTAKSVGVNESNIIISQRGSIIEGNNKSGFKITKKINCEPLLVSGSGVGDIGTVVLREREQLGSYGVVVITLLIDKFKKLVNQPFVMTRGFVYVKNSQELLKEISIITEEIYNKASQNNNDVTFIREEISKDIGTLLYKETEREPMIISIINFI